MAVATAHVLHGVQTPTSFLSQLESGRIVCGLEIQTGMAAGHPQPLFKAGRSQAPEFAFDTTQLATLFALSSSANAFCCADFTGGNTDFYLKRLAEHGYRQSGANHQRYRASHAFLLIESVRAQHQGEASASCRVLCGYDGTNEPIVPAGSQSLVGTPTADEYFAAGPVTINGAALNGVQSIEVDWGIQLLTLGGETEPWPTLYAIQSLAPRVTIECLDHPWTTFDLEGTALSSLTAWLRKKSSNGFNVANGTAQHIAFTASSGIVHVQESRGGNNDEATSTVICELRAANSTANALTVSTAATIT
jgi:hypothetical protein